MEGLVPFATAFTLVALSELGDKTQLVVFSLASRHPWLPVFLGASAGLVATTAIGVAAGAVLAGVLTPWIVVLQIGGGVLFIALGVVTLLRSEAPAEVETTRGPFSSAFGLTFVAEFGDKTQIAAIILAATSAAPWSVFAGASLALIVVAAGAVVLGAVAGRIVAARWLRFLSAGLFIAVGIFLIVEAVLTG